MNTFWNPWHGCRRVSEGCRNCYVYRIDGEHGKAGSEIRLNSDFLLPLRQSRGEWKIPSGDTVYTCFSSDFLLEEADAWRQDAWKMIKIRQDLHFIFFTKRIERFCEVLPPDWGDGYENVTVGCTCENQDRADYRMPLFLSAPIFRRVVVCEPLLGEIILSPFLDRRKIAGVTAGGESGKEARICDYEWILRLRRDCIAAGIPFHYHQTGALLRRGGILYRVPRSQQHNQARRAEAEWNAEP